MSLYKPRSSKYYWLEFIFEGQKHRLSTKHTNKRKAEEFEARYKAGVYEGRIGLETRKEKVSVPTFTEATTAFLKSLSAEDLKAATISRYESSSKAPVQYLGKKRIDRITREDIDNFKPWRLARKKKAPARLLKIDKKAKTAKSIAPASVNRELALIRMVMNYAKPGSWQAVTQRRGSRKFKFLKEDNQRTSMVILTQADERKYLLACPQPLRDIVSIVFDCGLRPEEVLELTAESLKNGVIQVEKGKTKAARRKVKMTERASSILNHRALQNPTGPLFPGGKLGQSDVPTKLTSLYRSHREARRAAGLESKGFRIYDARHTFATRLAEQGTDLVTLAAILGHASLAMVMRYAHPTEQHQAAAIEKLESLRKQA